MNILLIGASSSVGKVVSKAFLDAGHRVVETSKRDVNLEDPKSIRAFALLMGQSGYFADPPIDALVILVGVLPGKSLNAYDASEIARVMTINFVGPACLVKELLPHMGEGSRVLLMSSIAARGSFDPIYAASKAALEGFVRSMAESEAASKIRFNAIAPGLIADSSMCDAMLSKRRAEHVKQTPTGRLTTLSEIANIIVDVCCSPAWENVNGHVFTVDGGR